MSVKLNDLTGQQFGDYTPVKYLGKGKWECDCTCGEKAIKIGAHLTGGYSKYCTHNKKSNKFQDLLKQKFGKLTVVAYDGSSYWICRCECGNTRRVRSWELRQNKITECTECYSNPNRKKLEGHTLGGYKVIEYLGDKMYKCECIHCHREYTVARGGIDKNKYGCPDCAKTARMKHKLLNKKIGKLLVTEYLGGSRWKCKCDCGNEYIAVTSNLINKATTKMCEECYHKSQIKDITGEEFGDWIPVKYLGYQKWECKCKKCGNTYTRFGWNLRTLRSSICPCSSSSRPELDLLGYIKDTYKGELVHKDRKEIFPYELDIYIPEKRLAIEFNGTYWHSEDKKEPRYHQHKTIACARKGIHLVHIFEYEWLNREKQQKIKDYLSLLLGNNITRIPARKTEIKAITNEELTNFERVYHMQNDAKSYIRLGCFYNNKLIGVMGVGQPHFNNNYEYEIHRLCWKANTIVVGGTEKLFKHFIRNYNPQSIITYADLTKFTGRVYERLGFEPIQPKPITQPNYVWVHPHSKEVLTRYQTMKHKLVEKGLGAEDQTEDEIMASLGYLKIYDSGNIRLEWKGNNSGI